MVHDNIDELLHILSHRLLTPLYQPIVNMRDSQVYGFEALIRGPSDSLLHSPIHLFDTASRFHKLTELEHLARMVSVEQFVNINLPGKLFLNASPMTLLESSYPQDKTFDILRHTGLSPDKVVIEISEQYPLEDYDLIKQATHYFKSMGFEIAIDDLGSGYAGLRSWAEICPDYVKIDRHFITNIDTDIIKQEFVRSILEIAKSLNCQVIAEGVETAGELQIICQMGITYAQGYYLSRPLPKPPVHIDSDILRCDTCYNFSHLKRQSQSIGSLCKSAPTASSKTKTGDVIDLFRKSQHIQAIAIIDNDIPQGMVYRNTLLEIFSGRFGRDLHSKKSISNFIQSTLIVEHDTAVEDVSRIITDDTQLDFAQDFIITKNNKYLGIGQIRDLLKTITQLQINNARYSNPLTGLPGNVPIFETVDQLIRSGEDFHVAYCDLDNFKPYNDVYGYSRGDNILQAVARILITHCVPHHDFVGHIGGDDFVVIFKSDDQEERCKNILQSFCEIIKGFYNSRDIANNGIIATDRNGNQVHYPLLSLSIGLVNPDSQRCYSHHDVASIATEAKHNAKATQGNHLFISRRRAPNTQTASDLPEDMAISAMTQ
jgi:diguanylate cyclase (GGDEF)-like protein